MKIKKKLKKKKRKKIKINLANKTLFWRYHLRSIAIAAGDHFLSGDHLRSVIISNDSIFFVVVLILLAEPCGAYLVRMRDDMLLLHNWDNNYLFCSRTRL